MPNRNAYLGLKLHCKSSLESVANHLQAACTAEGSFFEPMPAELLHCTFFFAGEALRKLPAEQLTAWHAELMELVQEAGMAALDAELRFEGLDLFPPGKSCLIVARFAASARLIALQCAVEASAARHGIEHSGSQPRQAGEGGGWVAHCTLGKIRASKNEVAQVGACAIQTVLRDSPAALDAVRSAPGVEGILLCGETPKQAFLGWSFPFPGRLRDPLRIGKLAPQVMFFIFSMLDPPALASLELVSKRMYSRLRRYAEENPPQPPVHVMGLAYDYALVLTLAVEPIWERARLPSDVPEEGWIKPVDREAAQAWRGEALQERHITLLGGKSAKAYKKHIDLEKMQRVPIPPVRIYQRAYEATGEVGERACKAKREDRTSYFFAMGGQREWEDYVGRLCKECGFPSPERGRLYHFTVWNSKGGDPFRSISDVRHADME